MSYVALKSALYNGRQVHPGDLLPEAEQWGRAHRERRERSGLIMHVPEGHVAERIPGSWRWRVVPAPVAAPPAPSKPIEEDRSKSKHQHKKR